MGLHFIAPWALLALLSLPLLWVLLRATPPAPLRAMFPPLRLLHDLQDEEETPDSAPLWLRLLRLGIAIAVIAALAGPIWSPRDITAKDNPVVLIVDNGWASAPNWDDIQKNALGLASAGTQSIAMLLTANPQSGTRAVRFVSRADARKRLNDQGPKPWAPARLAVLTRLKALENSGGLPARTAIIWLSDGLDHGHARAFMAGLSTFGPVQVYTPARGAEPMMIAAPATDPRGLEITLIRAASAVAQTVSVQAMDEDGAFMAQVDIAFPKDKTRASATMELPLQLRNKLQSLQVPQNPSAGTRWIFDGGWTRPRVGLISPGGNRDRQPLLSGFYYLGKALAPHAELVRGALDTLLAQEPAVLVLIDPAQPTLARMQKIDAFVRAGGLLVRFAGPHLAARTDALIPVNLREGGRLMGGAFGWETPQALATFDPQSPFYGLKGGKDAAVRRQVLALPDENLNARVWARLEDGTPLVSSARHGAGRIVLFHVTAAPDWSDLPLSGLFAGMLERILAFSKNKPGAQEAAQNGNWTLEQALSADGKLHSTQGAQAFLPAQTDFSSLEINAQHPPGLYRNGPFTRALNLGAAKSDLNPLPLPPPGVTITSGGQARRIAFKVPLLLIALGLLGVDIFAALMLAGRLRLLRKYLPTLFRSAAMITGIMMVTMLAAPKVRAQDAFAKAIKAAQSTQLAYIITGDRRVDEMSKAGLYGLSLTLTQRTTVEPAAPVGLNPAIDDLSVFSFVYWPVLRPPELSRRAIAALDGYLKNGGMLVIDTQDDGLQAKAAGGVDPALKSVFSQISVPALRPVDANHVLTRTYYLIHDFAGRTVGGRVWVEADARGSSLDGVTGIIAGSNDWAAAWATNQSGQPIAALSDEIPRQREMARRFGINLVMYSLTGNYKADQVHIPALLERLGRQ